MLGRPGVRLLVATLAVSALAAGCGVLEQVQRVGVSAGTGGTGILVHHVPCPEETLTGITLALGDPEEGGTILWQVSGAGGQGPYTVGELPPGFTESVPFQQPPGGAQVTLEIATQHGAVTRTSSLTFDPASLEPDQIFTLGGEKDPATFERDALETCRED